MLTLGAEWGTGQIFWSMLWFFLFFLWIWLLIAVFSDIFRSPELSGWSKALWCLFVIVLPYLGVFVYLVARGGRMHEHALQQEAATQQYIRTVAATGPADQIERLAELRTQGVIDESEFQALKAKVAT